MTNLFRSSNIATKLITGSHILGAPVNPVKIPPPRETPVIGTVRVLKTVPSEQSFFLAQSFTGPFSCIAATKGINVMARRYVHTDVHFPSFDDVRRNATLDPTAPASESEDYRRSLFPALVYGVGGMIALIGVKETVQMIARFKWIPADQKALASIEVDLSEIPEGQVKTYEWRGKPIFVKHRTRDEIVREREVNMSDLRHPESDKKRVVKDEWLVVVGVCTHLGCVPIANAGEYHGYFCPCHGSHYDGSGRIRKGPAPLNLEVPEHSFTSPTTLLVGKPET